MKQQGLFGFVGVLVLSTLMSGCVSRQKYDEVNNDRDHLRQNLEDAMAYNKDLEGRNAELESQLMERTLTLQNVQVDAEELQRLRDQLNSQTAGLEGDGDWDIVRSVTENAYSFQLSDAKGSVLFEPGSASLTTEGKRILAKVAGKIQSHDHPIQVIGHTDSDPVVKTKDKYPRGNPELGADRAISVLGYLMEQGVGESRLSMASFGSTRPIPGAEKAKNRRVEVKVFLPQGS